MKLIVTGVQRFEEVTKFDGQDEPHVAITFKVHGTIRLEGDESAQAITSGDILSTWWKPSD